MLSDIAESVTKASSFDDGLSEAAEQISDMSYSIADCSTELNRFLYNLDIDPKELDEIEERLDVIYRLSKKYGNTEEEILMFL